MSDWQVFARELETRAEKGWVRLALSMSELRNLFSPGALCRPVIYIYASDRSTQY